VTAGTLLFSDLILTLILNLNLTLILTLISEFDIVNQSGYATRLAADSSGGEFGVGRFLVLPGFFDRRLWRFKKCRF